jgi:chromate transporter
MKELADIFSTFFKIGMIAFGGGYTVLPLLQKDIAERRNWATNEDIVDYYAISQSLPGIICVNIAMLIGYGRKKIPGLVAAGLGVAMPSLVIILIVALFLKNIIYLEIVKHAFNGIRVAVAALIVEASVNMWKSCVKDKIGVLIFLAALAVFIFADISPVFTVIAGAAAGITLMGRKR